MALKYGDMNIIDFLNDVENWYGILIKDYHVDIKQKDGFTLLKYNQIDTPKCWLTDQCRGSIFTQENEKWIYVCRPFNRFYNYGEERASVIDWPSAKVEEKTDGSLIKFWYYNNTWHWSTNGTIDSEEAELQDNHEGIKNFQELISYTLSKSFHTFEDVRFFTNLNKQYTYLFELCTRFNKVVIDYPEPTLFYLCSIHNETGKEMVFKTGFPRPKEHYFNTFEDCIEFSKNLPCTEEGYVIKDKFGNRNKAKGQIYLQLHRLKGETTPNNKRFLELARMNEGDEFITYFPEYKGAYLIIKDKYERYMQRVEEDWNLFSTQIFVDASRKTKATYIINNCINPAIMFTMLDKKGDSAKDIVQGMRIENLLSAIDKI
jgi:hypothetical protein